MCLFAPRPLKFHSAFPLSLQQLNNHTAEIKACSEHHKFLIGRNGVNIKRVRDKTGARIVFPSDRDEDKETIVIVGRKESVAEAKTELEALIKNLVRQLFFPAYETAFPDKLI